jgi:hypothetical protein
MIDVKLKAANRLAIKELQDNLNNLRPVFANFHTYMLRRVALQFRKLRRGGTFRSATWADFAPQYTRKTDGVTVPAWGGVARIHGGGKVLGRKRNSGKRVTERSALMADRGRLRNSALTSVKMSKNSMRIDTPVAYAKYQNAMRPFQYFEDPQDVNALRRLFRKGMTK